MSVEAYERMKKMLQLRGELLRVEEDRLSEKPGYTVDELDHYLSNVIREVSYPE